VRVDAHVAGVGSRRPNRPVLPQRAGDWVGQGEEATYTVADGPFSVTTSSYDNGITVSFHTPSYSHWWYLDLAAADGASLQAGTYLDAERYAFRSPGHPGLDFHR
jgi:hypothetical protein